MRLSGRFAVVATAVVVSACGATAQRSRPEGRVRVDAGLVTPEFLARSGFTPDHRHEDGAIPGYFDAGAEGAITAAELAGTVPAPEAEITADLFEGYHDYDALTAELRRIETAFPDLVRVETAGRSVQGRELWYVVVSDRVHENEHEPKFIYHANMHGDEVVGRELMIYFLRHLTAARASDPRVAQLVDHAEIFIMPSMNPDGFERGTRENARGYDLNRNFPDRFDDPSDTPAGRQVEVQHMMRLAQEHHFVYGINWHGGEICFNLPWGNISNRREENKYGDDAMFYPVGREYTQLNAPMYANHRANFDHGLTYGYEWYPVSGGINDWMNFFRRSVHSVVELSVTKWPNSRYLAGFWSDNREAMVTYLWRGLRGAHLKVTDQAGAVLQGVGVALASAPRRPLTFDDGWIHRLTADGTQTVTLSAPGMRARTVDVTARYFDGVYDVVALDPL